MEDDITTLSLEPIGESRVPAEKKPVTVLIVEDEQSVRETTRMLLEMSGYRVLTAEDGAAGVGIFSREFRRIDVVLLDYQMPKMNGDQALSEMLAIDPGARIILTSGLEQDGPAGELKGIGAVGVLNKPYRLGQLLDAIRGALEPRSLGEG